jgi:hypothetical protein
VLVAFGGGPESSYTRPLTFACNELNFALATEGPRPCPRRSVRRNCCCAVRPLS